MTRNTLRALALVPLFLLVACGSPQQSKECQKLDRIEASLAEAAKDTPELALIRKETKQIADLGRSVEGCIK